MTTRWRTKSLGEVCTLVNGGTPKTGVSEYWDGDHLWITPAEMGKRLSPYVNETERKITDAGLRDSSARMLPENSVILSSRAPIGHLVINTKPMATNQGCKGLVPAQVLNHKFLYYYLSSIVDLLNELGTGTTFKELSGGKLKEVPIPLPPVTEQQHIVAILDEAFDGIVTAKANAEKNLRNARHLSESQLDSILTRGGIDFPMSRLDDVTNLARGHNPPKSKFSTEAKPGYVRFYQIRDGSTDAYTVYVPDTPQLHKMNPDDIMMVAYRHIGRVFRGVSGAFNVALCKIGNARRDLLNDDYLFHIIPSRYVKGELLKRSERSLIPSMSIEHLREIKIPLPSLFEQQQIVARIRQMSAQTQRLESIYQQKLAALDELKKSLLRQAFTGQLTAGKPTLASQHRELKTATPQFAANIISLAYARHAKKQRERTFGRVKEQKVLHLVEAIAKIDLGRQPMKDAAGPNDFQHMLKAEDWAKKQDFFEMVVRGNGYDFKKLKGFDPHLSKARQELAPYLSNIEKVIDLLIPMDSEEAGVFATVHAAWNNLLIDGIEATDGAILKEARDTWHADKLSIPEHKFKKAIEFIRSKGLIPDGTGKYVTGQKSLL